MIKHIKAIFRGTNGSCGYETGKEYYLTVQHRPNENIKIENKVGGKNPCEYESFCSFLSNWDDIRLHYYE